MTTYYWTIESMQTAPSEDGLTDVVKVVFWRRFAQQDELLVSNFGAMGCATPSSTDFTAYPDLTYEQVCSWLDSGIDTTELDLNLDKQLENLINPPVVTLPLPFSNP
jgi:hypothetical protein